MANTIPEFLLDAIKQRLDQRQVGGDHYSKLELTPWEALEKWLTPEEFRGYLKGEAIVYLARERSKAGPVDVSKARHVLQKLEEFDARRAAAVSWCRACEGKPCQRLDGCPYQGPGAAPAGPVAPQTPSGQG